MKDASAILELVDLEIPCESRLYRAGDRLLRCAMQHGLYAEQLPGFSETLLLFELTNTFYTGRKKGALLEYGCSKQKRSNSPLVTVALTLEAPGFVRSARILPGNASEPKTLQKAVEERSSSRVSLIMDAGIATRANLVLLKEKGLDWIYVQRSKTPPAPEDTPDECCNTNSGIAIKAWRMADKDEEALYDLQSAARKSTGDSILDARRAKFEAALTKLHEGPSKPRCVKDYNKLQRRLGREIEKHKHVACRYTIEVQRRKHSTLAEAVTFTHKAAIKQKPQAATSCIPVTRTGLPQGSPAPTGSWQTLSVRSGH